MPPVRFGSKSGVSCPPSSYRSAAHGEQEGLQTLFEVGNGRCGDDVGRQIVPHSRCGSTKRTITDCSESCATHKPAGWHAKSVLSEISERDDRSINQSIKSRLRRRKWDNKHNKGAEQETENIKQLIAEFKTRLKGRDRNAVHYVLFGMVPHLSVYIVCPIIAMKDGWSKFQRWGYVRFL